MGRVLFDRLRRRHGQPALAHLPGTAGREILRDVQGPVRPAAHGQAPGGAAAAVDGLGHRRRFGRRAEVPRAAGRRGLQDLAEKVH